MRILISLVLACFGAAGLAAAPDYKVDRNHSNVGFAAPILGGLSKVQGKFTDFAVELRFDEHDIANSSIRAVIKPASIDTGIADRDEHLRSPDFFDVAKFPEVVFASSRIEKTAGGFVAHGKLTLRDVTRDIALPFRLTGRFGSKDDKGALETLGFSAAATLDRRDYGMNWKHGSQELFVGDLIDIEIAIVTRARRLP
jgi:polyisoprenoid-binding protein YceI